MSLFSFGQNNAQQQNTAAPAIPSLSVTGATPAAQPAAPFSFGAQPAQNTGASAPPASAPGATGASGTGLFDNFGSNQQQQQQQPAGGTGTTGSLFGNLGQNNQNQQNQQPAAAGTNTGGSLFGGGGLFGNKSTTAPAAGTSSGFGTSSLFGGQNQQQQPNAQGSSLFGNTNAQQQQPAQQTSSLFGSTNPAQQGTSLFGGSTSQPQQPFNQAGGSLFGQSQNQPQQQTSMFGQPNQQNSQQSQQGGSGGINGSTKFTDLPEQHQKMIEEMDRVFKEQKAKASGFNGDKIGRAIQQTLLDVQAAEREYVALNQSFRGLANAIMKQSGKNLTAEKNLKVIVDLVEAQKAPDSRAIARNEDIRKFPGSFFETTAVQSEERVSRYKKTIADLRRAVESLALNDERASPEVIGKTIQSHHDAILTLAGRINETETRLSVLRVNFTDIFQEVRNTARDPFELERERQNRPARKATT